MTPTQLKHRVLEKLGVLATGESPTIADATLVGDRYVSLHKMLLDEKMIDWTNSEDVPALAEDAVTMMVAAFSMHEFGLPDSRKAQLTLEGGFNLPARLGGPSLAEQQLRAQAAARFVYFPQPVEYF